MRLNGERYIRIYRPNIQQIKLIRAMRLCKSPALGGKVIVCKKCAHQHYIYYSCGHSHCPICQSIKRAQWADRLRAELYKVPYIHTTFTLPHQLNGLARANQTKVYGLLMRVAWKTIKQVSQKEANIGALPGMIAVLHTFGSDMKYHVHVHCLITFGGLTKEGKWRYPKRKNKIARYRELCAVFRELFLREVKRLFDKKALCYHQSYEELSSELQSKRWVVHNTPPTMDTKVLESYLAKYINRVAISNSRLTYLHEQHKVNIIYNDYKNQQAGCPAPKTLKTLDPLVAIDQIMQHVLPPYFQKSRRYGLHAPATKRRLENVIPDKIKRNGQTVRTLLQILTQLLKVKPFECSNCQSTEYIIQEVKKDKSWIQQYIAIPNCRPPPNLSCILTPTLK